MGPEWIVLIVSSLGTLISGYLLVDAYKDRKAVIAKLDDNPKLEAFTRQRLVSEIIRLTIILSLVFIGIAVIIGGDRLEQAAIWVLVSIPIILTFGSIYSWVQRFKTLD